MRKSEKIQIVKNVGSSWFALGVNILVGLFLSPLILHRLGDTAFGIWVLIFSITGYYGLFDLGIRSSVVRYVSKFTAIQDHESLAMVMNSSMLGYLALAGLSMMLTLFIGARIGTLFHIPPQFQSTARWLIIMAGSSVAVGFPLGIFGGVLEGLQRFYVLNWTNIATTLLRAALIVVFLGRGCGLLTVGFITVFVPFLASLVRCFIALRILPIPWGLHYVDRATLREIAGYSGSTFIMMVSARLKFRTDELVIGTFISATAITYFNIGNRIVDYVVQMVTSLSQIFVPMSSQSEARGNMDALRTVFIAGNRVCGFIVFPICATLIILGKSVIEVWVGRKYVATSYPILVIMLLSSTLMLAQSASPRLLMGIGKHRTWALVSLLEGGANLVLSILLVRPYGIIGDAFGTAIPLCLSFLVFMPRHLCRLLGIKVVTYLREAYVLPLTASLPLVMVLLLMRRWFVAHTYWQLAIHLLAGGTMYGLCLLWVYSSQRALAIGDLSPSETSSALPVKSVTPAVEVSP